MSRKMIDPSVADELLWDSLSIELRSAVERLFHVGKRVHDELDRAYARGYRAGFNAQLPDDIKMMVAK